LTRNHRTHEQIMIQAKALVPPGIQGMATGAVSLHAPATFTAKSGHYYKCAPTKSQTTALPSSHLVPPAHMEPPGLPQQEVPDVASR